MTLQEKEILRIIQGRLEGIACGVNNDNIERTLLDTAELIIDIIQEDEEKK